jgi:hypothetical protein
VNAVIDRSQFEQLTLSARAALLWTEGVFIAGTIDRATGTSFYGLFGYYVEAIIEGDEIKAIHAFATGDRFDRMLALIDVQLTFRAES